MKSYRDNSLEQISRTQLNATYRYFILVEKINKRKITKYVQVSFSQRVKLWQLMVSRFHTLINLVRPSSNKLFYGKSGIKDLKADPDHSVPTTPPTHTHPGFALAPVCFQKPTHLLGLPPNCHVMKADNQGKYSQVHYSKAN